MSGLEPLDISEHAGGVAHAAGYDESALICELEMKICHLQGTPRRRDKAWSPCEWWSSGKVLGDMI